MEQTPTDYEKQWVNELHPSFLRHAHRRITKLGSRCKHLCNTGWDINLVAILHNDAAILAGQCGAAGLVEESHQLHQLEQLLGTFLKEQRLPSKEELDEIVRQCSTLELLERQQNALELEPVPTATPVGQENDDTEEPEKTLSTEQHPHPCAPGPKLTALPQALLASLPQNRWVDVDHAQAPTKPTNESSVVKPETDQAGPVIVLCATEPMQTSPELQSDLAKAGFHVKTCQRWEDCLSLAQSSSAGAILLAAKMIDDPAQVKLRLERLKADNGNDPALLVIGDTQDIAERVQAMRMGARRYFPAGTPSTEIIQQVMNLAGHEKQQESARVLVVDDDEAQARFAKSILEKSGMEVRAITHPLEVLDILESFSPDLILMDLYMPDVNGAELTGLIRENEKFLGIPIVFLSGEHDEERQFEALQMGGDDFLEKPIKPKHLIAAVNSRIQRSRKLRERKQLDSQATSPEQARLALIDRLNALLDEDDLSNKAFVYLTLKNRIAFKEILGYQHLDQAMNQLLDHLQQQLPTHCSAARFGEFSFALLCTQADPTVLHSQLESLCTQAKQFSLQPDKSRQPLLPDLAAGYTWLEHNPRDAARIIAQAEKAAHQAQGKTPPIHEAAKMKPGEKLSKDERKILDLVRQSLTDETLQLLFQPLINLNDNSQEQYQTLLRLMTPEQDFIPASRFIPVAEKHGLITELDQWVMHRALDTLAHRMRLNRPIRLFVSQSVHSWMNTHLVEWLENRVKQNHFPANLLCLEFNSNHLTPEQAASLESHLRSVRTQHVQLCISRFDHDGLHRKIFKALQPEYVKLDPSLLHDGQFMTELPNIVGWLHEQQSKVIIPRVEQALDAANFWTSGVDFLQGNFIQSPDSKLQFDFQGSAF